MKVSHLHDMDTHAVIGGKNVVEFKIAQTAEFFTVLSSTLYSNKPLAVIREVLCNAWDSHIASNITDKTVNVTLNDNQLIIRDYGKGIHPDNMQDIYCVYGNSTKANDGNQTGGFGLGSKAPFAYSDHFTVTTFHEGLKTVYAISRGSQLTKGKPDLRVMVQVPTTETGLEVNIPVKNYMDKNTFTGIINQIASFGEMNVSLNNEPIEIIPISKAKDNIFITREQAHDFARIKIRYGNVVYPISPHENYILDYNNIIKNLDSIPSGGYNNKEWSMIIQAPNNSISVTPSRESLSMTDTTINTISSLLKDINNKFNINSKEFSNLLMKNIDNVINSFWLKGIPNQLLTNTRNNSKLKDVLVPSYLSSIEDIANYYSKTSSNLPEYYLNKEFDARLDSLIENNYRRKQDIFRFKQIIKFENKKYININKNKIFNKVIFRPIIKSLVKHPILNVKNMFITTQKPYYERSNLSIKFAPIVSAVPRDDERANLLQAVVIIATSKSSINEHYDNKIFGSGVGNYVYITNRNDEHKQAAIDHFTKLGFYVIDHTIYMDNLPKPANSDYDYIPPPKKPKVEGLITLESLVTSHNLFVMNRHRSEKIIHKRIINPEFVFRPHALSGSEWQRKFFEFGDEYGTSIVSLFGSKGGITVNDKQYDHYILKGAKDGYVYLVEQICNEMLTNPRIRSYLEFKSVPNLSSNFENFLQIANYNYLIKTKYNLPTAINDIDKKYIYIYEHMSRRAYNKNWYDLFTIKIKEINQITLSKNYIDLIESFNNSKITKVLDWDQILHSFKQNPKLTERIKLEMLVITALE